jgi:hypothetical protein
MRLNQSFGKLLFELLLDTGIELAPFFERIDMKL